MLKWATTHSFRKVSTRLHNTALKIPPRVTIVSTFHTFMSKYNIFNRTIFPLYYLVTRYAFVALSEKRSSPIFPQCRNLFRKTSENILTVQAICPYSFLVFQLQCDIPLGIFCNTRHRISFNFEWV